MLGIVIPAYNEPNIDKSIFEIRKVFPEAYILVSVDGGCFETAKLAQNAGAEVYWEKTNYGKGHAVRKGILKILETSCDIVMFTDADLACPPEEWNKLVKSLKTSDVAIASRKLPGSVVEQTLSRKIASDAFALYARNITGMRFSDFQCGCKMFWPDIARRLFEEPLLSNRYCFDVEILYRARGLKISEVPVKWKAGEKSSVKLLKDSIEMALEVIKLAKHYKAERVDLLELRLESVPGKTC